MKSVTVLYINMLCFSSCNPCICPVEAFVHKLISLWFQVVYDFCAVATGFTVAVTEMMFHSLSVKRYLAFPIFQVCWQWPYPGLLGASASCSLSP